MEGRRGGGRRKASNYTEEVVRGLDLGLVRHNDHYDYSSRLGLPPLPLLLPPASDGRRSDREKFSTDISFH